MKSQQTKNLEQVKKKFENRQETGKLHVFDLHFN